ncbi:MAG: hypothetical protein ABJA82_02765 [Myxococcales bacterium]
MKEAVTDEILSASLDRMKEATFDSHAVIRDLMTYHPQEYVTDLASQVASKDPILTYHAGLGSRLANWPSIERTTKVMSVNVRGQVTENQGWKKK